MKNKTFETNPLTGRLVALLILGLIGYVAGALVILYENSLSTGLAVIIATSIGEAILIADAISNLSCPECGERLHRDRKADKHVVRYICLHCETTWVMPAADKSQIPNPKSQNPDG